MATIVLTAGANSKTWTLPPADIQRILDGVKKEVNNPAMTNAQCFDWIANRFMSSLDQMTIFNEKKTQAEAIVVPPLDIT